MDVPQDCRSGALLRKKVSVMTKRVVGVAFAVLTAFAVLAFIAYGTLGSKARIRAIAIKVCRSRNRHSSTEEWIVRETKHDGDQWEVQQVVTQETNMAFYVTVSTSGKVLAIVSADERASDGSDVRP